MINADMHKPIINRITYLFVAHPFKFEDKLDWNPGIYNRVR